MRINVRATRARARTLFDRARALGRKGAKLEMDETGAVGVAREKLERRRQEAYKARAAATVTIQRWYRRYRLRKGRIYSQPLYEPRHCLDDNHQVLSQPSSEQESCTASNSTAISNLSEQENQGELPLNNIICFW